MNEQDIEKELQSKGLNAPRITPDHIQRVQKCGQYYRFPGTTVIVCCITLENGYTVTGESACASPENFDEEIGRKIAQQNAVNKIWGLEGYLLRQKLHEQTPPAVGTTESCGAMPISDLQPHQQRVVDERNELEDRLYRLSSFIAGTVFPRLPEQDRQLLEAQQHTMSAYVEVLTQRIELFTQTLN